MNAWLDANVEGLAFILIFGLIGIAALLVAAVIDKVHETRRFRLNAIDERRCERAGSQNEFTRRLRARGVR
jgi:hypothetical protein